MNKYIYENETYERLRYEFSLFLKEYGNYKEKFKEILFNPIYNDIMKYKSLYKLVVKIVNILTLEDIEISQKYEFYYI